jgi:hypothetical protein
LWAETRGSPFDGIEYAQQFWRPGTLSVGWPSLEIELV